MIRSLTAAGALLALSALGADAALSATAASAPASKARAAKKAPAKNVEPPEPEPVMRDDLDPVLLTIADRVLTGVADCEFKQKVEITKVEGHNGNFRLSFDRKNYIMVPEETTTGAIRLVDTKGAVVWVQIPKKSMLMNQQIHQRMVDDCQADEQRIASRAAAEAGANAPFLAPSAATPASAAAAVGHAMPASAAAAMEAASGASAPSEPGVVTTTTVTTTTQVVPPPPPVAPLHRAASAPAEAASAP